MSFYPSDQRCPRCQYPITPGAQTCGNCGLALTAPQQPSYGGFEPPPPPPSPYNPPSAPFGPPPGTGGGAYGGNSGYAGTGGYDYTPQPPPPPPTFSGGPTYYPGSQPQPGFPGSAPAYAGSQPQPGFPTPGTPQPPQRQSRTGLRIAVIALVILVILGGVGGAAYVLTRPKPTISVTSTYHRGTTPAGANSTTLTVSGSKFSSNSTITFLLDGQPAPDTQTSLSDSQGNVKVDLKISANWGVGPHTLTARDGSNYTTQQGTAVLIVNPGDAHTPGPNGAPPDDTSFLFHATINAQDALTGETFQPFTEDLSVTGQADPAGGKVCNSADDDGNPHNLTGQDSSGNPYTETFIWTCTGTYKGGQLTYTETATKDVIVFKNGSSCTAQTPYAFEHLEGSFTNTTSLNGTYSDDAVTFNCSDGSTQQLDPSKGTWTATSH